MLANERHEEILNRLSIMGSVNVRELTKSFGVTSETIRRDLDLLDQRGELVRIHGGAVRLPDSTKETPYFTRKITNTGLKKELAQKALKNIQEHDQIILDASSTAWFMAQSLPNIQITVLTNSLLIASELAIKENINLICVGGTLLRTSQAFVGPTALNTLSQYHVSKLFMSSSGIHLEWGMSEPNESAVLVKQKMIEIADEVYALMDSSKFGMKALVRVCSLDQIDYIITNEVNGVENAKKLENYASKVIY